MTKIFTMVKGEVDIVYDWVLYHGKIFGFKNLYIVDNFSQDGTWRLLQQLKMKYHINICQLPDFKKKGQYMTKSMRTFCGKGELAFPINIDEFIVCYDKQKNAISCDSESFSETFKKLPLAAVYKMNYIQCKIVAPNGYKRAALEATSGSYVSCGTTAKCFFNTALFNGIIDHNNHYNTKPYVLSDFCLVHYHCRNLGQIKMKIYNNVLGLGYNPVNLRALKQCLPNYIGYKHIRGQIDILENKFKMPCVTKADSDVDLTLIGRMILGQTAVSEEEPVVTEEPLVNEEPLVKIDENITIVIEELDINKDAKEDETIPGVLFVNEEEQVIEQVIEQVTEPVIEPVITVEEPIAIIEEPIAIIEEPIIEPVITVEEPVIEPVITVEEPIIEPVITVEEPQIFIEAIIEEVLEEVFKEVQRKVDVEEIALEDPPVALEEVVVEEPEVVVEEPEVVVEEPEVVVEEVVIEEVVVEEPEVVVEEPEVVIEEVVVEEVVIEEVVVEEVVVEEPEVVIEEPPVVVEEVAVEEPPVVVEEVVIEEPPVVVEEVVIEEPPVVVEEVVIEEPPVVVEEVVIEEPPVIVEEAEVQAEVQTKVDVEEAEVQAEPEVQVEAEEAVVEPQQPMFDPMAGPPPGCAQQ